MNLVHIRHAAVVVVHVVHVHTHEEGIHGRVGVGTAIRLLIDIGGIIISSSGRRSIIRCSGRSAALDEVHGVGRIVDAILRKGFVVLV